MNTGYTREAIFEDLRRKIEAGYLKNGEKLPAEEELMRIYGVGRLTIRNALQDLVEKKLVKRVRGRGSFVISQKLDPLTTLFPDTWSWQCKRRRIVEAGSTLSQNFNIPSDTPVLLFEIQWREKEEPICNEKFYVNPLIIPEILKMLHGEIDIHPLSHLSRRIEIAFVRENYAVTNAPRSLAGHSKSKKNPLNLSALEKTSIYLNNVFKAIAVSHSIYKPGQNVSILRRI